jgi:cell wall-associated NlpC family hydrolase
VEEASGAPRRTLAAAPAVEPPAAAPAVEPQPPQADAPAGVPPAAAAPAVEPQPAQADAPAAEPPQADPVSAPVPPHDIEPPAAAALSEPPSADAAAVAASPAPPAPGGPEVVSALLENPRLSASGDVRASLLASGADPRLISLVEDLLEHHAITISAVDPTGHAIDIATVDGTPVSPSNLAARDVATEIAALDPSLRPSSVVTPWPIEGFSTDPTQADHIHLAFDAPPVEGVALPVPDPDAARGLAAVAIAKTTLGTPYVWGGESYGEGGFDCSGLMQWTYEHLGIQLPRVTYDQIDVGVPVARDQLQPGDLVFFGDPAAPHHVGMYVGDNQFIEAPYTGADVRISVLDRADFAGARRVTGLADPSAPVPAGSEAPAIPVAEPAGSEAPAIPVAEPDLAPSHGRASGVFAAVRTSHLAERRPGSTVQFLPAVGSAPAPEHAAPVEPAPVEPAPAEPAPVEAVPAEAVASGSGELSFPQSDAGLAARIDEFLASRGSPMAGYGQAFVDAGRAYDVDPRLLVSISGIETSFGTASGAGTDIVGHNAWGWGPHIAFADWPTAIDTITKGLRDGYLSQGLTTIDQIVGRYAPASDGNDESGWAATVGQYFRELGGGPSGP